MRSTFLSALCMLALSRPLLAQIPPAPAQLTESLPAVQYHIRAGDTLIGLGRRLLVRDSLWHDLAALNHVALTRRLQPGSTLRIPIAWIRWSERAAHVLAVSGETSVNGRSLEAGSTINAGDTLVTGHDGSLTVALSDGSELSVPPATTLTFESMRAAPDTDAPDIDVQLREGNLEVSAHKHHDVGRFEIRSPTAVIAVRGTTYRTHFNQDSDSATAETLEGTVQVSGATGPGLPLNAGFGTQVRLDHSPLAPVPLLPAPDLSAVPPTSSVARPALAIGAVAGAHSYRVQLATTPDFRVLEFEVLMPGTLAQLPALADGPQWLRARAIDEYGIEGRDAVASFTQHTLPSTPMPTAQTAPQETTAVLGWSGDAMRYRVAVLTDDGASPVMSLDVEGHELATDTLPPGRYRWKVQALSDHGEAGPWSAEQALMLWPRAPHITAIRSLHGHRLEISWTPAPGFGVQLQLARDAAFRQPLTELQSDGNLVTLKRPHAGRYFVRARWTQRDGLQGVTGPTRPVIVWPSAWWLVLVPAAIAAPFL